jgi:uncharacterized membrane protein
MTLGEHLDEFYRKYNIPANGGVDDKTFEIPFPYFTLTLPNFSWRKRALYVHDLEHILNEQDTSWSGEMFIASWEISTGFWKNLPVIIFPIWTMGWGLWKHPTSVLRGFRAGNSQRGIANLEIEKDKLLNMDLDHLRMLMHKCRGSAFPFLCNIRLICWVLISQLVFLFPLLILLCVLALSL